MKVNGKVYDIIKDMYTSTYTRVKLPDGLTESFRTNSGIRQGDSLSPLLFNLYIDQIKSIFDSSCDPASLNEVAVSHLLYADDLIIISESPEGLQESLNRVDQYCKEWKLEINVKKTKVVIFRQGIMKHKPSFHIGNQEIDIVDQYKYLGLTLNYDGSFKAGVEELCNKALKAWYSLRNRLDPRDVNNPKIMLKLYDMMIRPISTYACEVWSQQYCKTFQEKSEMKLDALNFEKVHNTILKQILGVSRRTSNSGVKLELGRSPISFFVIQQSLNFLVKLEKADEHSLLGQALASEK